VAIVDRITWVMANGVRWTGALATEVALLPATLRHAREAVVAITVLPPQVERLNVALEDASGTLEAHVPELSRVVIGELAGTVEALGSRVHGLVDVIDDALPALTGLLETLPGQLDTFDRVVGEVGTSLGEVLPKLETDELRERVEHLDVVVSELSRTLTGVLQGIPGVRRSMKAG
jgi:ABC-type transporter Mla subunit MlaD